MSNTCGETEQLIVAQSKILFYRHGKIKATTQEIADFCNIQRTLVNYYFRSKENLFAIVHKEVLREMHLELNRIYSEEIPFEQKIEELIDYTFEFKIKYPFFELFNITMSNNLIESNVEISPKLSDELALFLKEIEQQMDLGKIQKTNPINFIINILSLVSFPLVMENIFKDLFNLTKEEYRKLVIERKTVIKNLIFNT